jgi:hypothetical protein
MLDRSWNSLEDSLHCRDLDRNGCLIVLYYFNGSIQILAEETPRKELRELAREDETPSL